MLPNTRQPSFNPALEVNLEARNDDYSHIPASSSSTFLPPLSASLSASVGFYFAYSHTSSLAPSIALAATVGVVGWGCATVLSDERESSIQSKAVHVMIPVGLGAMIATPLILLSGPRSFIPHYGASVATISGWLFRYEILNLIGMSGIIN
jgi:hypothetical protein